MKKYLLVTPEALNKIGQCFSSAEEMQTFLSQMDQLIQEVMFLIQMRTRVKEEYCPVLLLQQSCVFSIFCREHIELIQQLIANLDCKEMTEDEINNYQEE